MVQRPVHGRDHRLQVRPGGHLRDHAAEAGVLLDRARDRVSEQRPAADDTDPGLVAGRLDSEDEGFGAHPDEPRRGRSSPVRVITQPSTPPGRDRTGTYVPLAADILLY